MEKTILFLATSLTLTSAPAFAECTDRWSCLFQYQMTEFKQASVNNALQSAREIEGGDLSDQSGEFMRQQGDFAHEQVANQVMNGLLSLAATNGKRLFGANFRMVSDLSYSPGQGITGDWDAVVPLGFSAAPVAGGKGALFLQSGATHYRQDGIHRNDNRYGSVWRFAVSDKPQADVFGTWAFMQRSAEYGHERLHLGGDYASGRANLSLDWFLPLTDWRTTRAGYEERALEISSVAMHYALTPDLTLGSGIQRREDANGGGGFSTGALLNLAWSPPRRQFSMNTIINGIGSGDDPAFNFIFNMPLGGVLMQARREGLPVKQTNKAAFTDLYRPVASTAGRIEVAEREIVSPSLSIDDVRLRFLQASAGSGSKIRLEAELSAPASADVRLLLKLMPGNGENPVVLGEDYTDEPIEVKIHRGESTATATIRLLINPSLSTDRSLSAKVLSVSS